jgi:methionyl-tRNA formyltransferase
LLPRWRGAAPVHAAILHGDAQSGVSIMQMDPGLDTGPIISQRQIPIILDETGGDLSSRLAALGAELLDETLIPYSRGELQPVPQNDNQATHAPLLKKSDGLLDWRKTAIELDRQVRAFEPWPGSFFHWKQRRITVRKAHSQSCESANPARVVLTGELPAVGTSAGLLVLDILQPAGRTSMPADTYLRGAPNFINAALHLPD